MPSTTTGAVSVVVPAITDPDTASVDVTISAGQGYANIGDVVIATPLEALEAACLLLGASVTAANTIRVVFSSVGGNVTGGAKNFRFHIIYS